MNNVVSFEIDGDFESNVGESEPIEFHGGFMVCEIGCLARECTDSSLECSALNTLVLFLNHSGHDASFKCAAEMTSCSWTMDGVLEIDGKIWVIDHTRLTWPYRTKPWMKEACDLLREELEKIAQDNDVNIYTIIPDLRGQGDKGTRRIKHLDFIRHLDSALSETTRIISKPTEFRELPGGYVYQLLPKGDSETESKSRVGISFLMASGMSLDRQFTEFNLPTVLAKLNSQLAPKLGKFDHAGLLLDQRYFTEEEPPLTNSILTPTSMRSVLESEKTVLRSRLDQVWLIGEGGYMEEVWSRDA